ncbi:UDP-N-acetylglucosamine 2-epimerase (non-hydrolysing) [Oryzomicrobium terrae]|uniref:UDP-N-acetylglucosamine 2-epimerase (non-hydrolyzing) n=1 Tax=Oryzomicrobium terrae TaxID=1735038 RepID=A0A5C1E5S5_9RHOO|nr:UDP-N-acetylglucosamine 2-epimerase (non-hydrolyzing) [Oryzomicrobium terrae]QEL63627.1 UDP-N-acetylglucosamine 2-epimerase (non-hydrolysing) [Oryzomicrobium terrae]
MTLSSSILLCMGTRPEIIKMAPVYHALKAANLRPLVLHTGQHREMANPMYEFFGMQPALSLELERRRESLSHLSSLMVDKIGKILEDSAPSAVLVHGDTSSALMAALAAFYQQIPVGHVEAGLRSHCAYDPFPEEKNRELIGRLASWHFAPTAQARANLLREGIAAETIHTVGNTIVDAVHLAGQMDGAKEAAIPELQRDLARLPALLPGRRLMLVTSHRRENLDGPLANIAGAVRDLLLESPDLLVVWPVHANPRVKETVHAVLDELPAEAAERLFLTQPMGYAALMWLLHRAWLVLTDSGGIQEEAAAVHTPILVLRETTERPELIEAGAGRLVGTDRQTIVTAVRELATRPETAAAMRNAINPFGDGHAGQRIAQVLSTNLAPQFPWLSASPVSA